MLFSALPSEYFIDASLLAPKLTAYDIQKKNENKEKRMLLSEFIVKKKRLIMFWTYNKMTLLRRCDSWD